MKELKKPDRKEVNTYLEIRKNLENYVNQENSLKKLFQETYPFNKDINEILIKVSSLNDFYSTNIFNVFAVANHILNLSIDERLNKNDATLVNDIAKNKIDGKEKNFYSFATKYCSHHNPTEFPIYDSYVEKVLMYFNRKDKFAKFEKTDLKNYKKYKEILNQFKEKYNINNYNLKELDRYLWLLGKHNSTNPKIQKQRDEIDKLYKNIQEKF